jgi:hypothetical protein
LAASTGSWVEMESTRVSTRGPMSDDLRSQTLRPMTITEYLMNIALVSLVVLQIRGHKITVARLLVPVVMTVWFCSQILHTIPTAGNDEVLEGSLALVGAGLGVSAGLATSIRRLGAGAFAKAGAVAAVLWVAGVGARVAFSVWVTNGGQPTITRFSVAHHITSGHAWAAAFILMAMVEVTSRTCVLYLKTVRSGAVIPRGGLVSHLRDRGGERLGPDAGAILEQASLAVRDGSPASA